MKYFFFCILLFFVSTLFCSIRAVWVPIWDLTSEKQIDQVLSDCKKNDMNQVLAEVRYRADALYKPNKKDSTYKNYEVRSYVLQDSTFDPLEYLILQSKKLQIEVIAWATMYVSSPHSSKLIPKNHLLQLYPNWITYNFRGDEMAKKSLEGIYLDPGLKDVKEYLFQIIMDIAINYDIDGIHFDYIRYPEISYGYHPDARNRYESEVKSINAESWQNWKENQIISLIKEIYWEVKRKKPQLIVSAAVIANIEKATNMYAQNWLSWIDQDIVDFVYLMAYSKNTSDIQKILDLIKSAHYKKKIVVGLRAWDETKKYKLKSIHEKIKLIKAEQFAGFALFSSTGIRQNNYFPIP